MLSCEEENAVAKIVQNDVSHHEKRSINNIISAQDTKIESNSICASKSNYLDKNSEKDSYKFNIRVCSQDATITHNKNVEAKNKSSTDVEMKAAEKIVHTNFSKDTTSIIVADTSCSIKQNGQKFNIKICSEGISSPNKNLDHQKKSIQNPLVGLSTDDTVEHRSTKINQDQNSFDSDHHYSKIEQSVSSSVEEIVNEAGGSVEKEIINNVHLNEGLKHTQTKSDAIIINAEKEEETISAVKSHEKNGDTKNLVKINNLSKDTKKPIISESANKKSSLVSAVCSESPSTSPLSHEEIVNKSEVAANNDNQIRHLNKESKKAQTALDSLLQLLKNRNESKFLSNFLFTTKERDVSKEIACIQKYISTNQDDLNKQHNTIGNLKKELIGACKEMKDCEDKFDKKTKDQLKLLQEQDAKIYKSNARIKDQTSEIDKLRQEIENSKNKVENEIINLKQQLLERTEEREQLRLDIVNLRDVVNKQAYCFADNDSKKQLALKEIKMENETLQASLLKESQRRQKLEDAIYTQDKLMEQEQEVFTNKSRQILQEDVENEAENKSNEIIEEMGRVVQTHEDQINNFQRICGDKEEFFGHCS